MDRVSQSVCVRESVCVFGESIELDLALLPPGLSPPSPPLHTPQRTHPQTHPHTHPHLETLPGQPPLEQKQQRVGEGLEVVAAAGGAAQVRMHAGVPHRTAEVVRPLVVPHMCTPLLPFGGCGGEWRGGWLLKDEDLSRV
jgi:hypothetical protein